MASEAELERLYQEFVLRGGGVSGLSNVNTTPNNIIILFQETLTSSTSILTITTRTI